MIEWKCVRRPWVALNSTRDSSLMLARSSLPTRGVIGGARRSRTNGEEREAWCIARDFLERSSISTVASALSAGGHVGRASFAGVKPKDPRCLHPQDVAALARALRTSAVLATPLARPPRRRANRNRRRPGWHLPRTLLPHPRPLAPRRPPVLPSMERLEMAVRSSRRSRPTLCSSATPCRST